MAELGALASVVGIARAGAKLSIAIFEFASTFGSARSEILSIGTEISQFCVIVKQIESTLSKAKKTVRYSLTALLAIAAITDRCQIVFKEIEDILTSLKKGKAEPKFLGGLIWPVKRVKVEVLRKTLESSKLTLSCMLMALLFAENTASRSTSTEQTQQQDADQQAVTQSLIIAEQCSIDELEILEDEEHEAEEVSHTEATSDSSLGSRDSRIVNRELLAGVGQQKKFRTTEQRHDERNERSHDVFQNGEQWCERCETDAHNARTCVVKQHSEARRNPVTLKNSTPLERNLIVNHSTLIKIPHQEIILNQDIEDIAEKRLLDERGSDLRAMSKKQDTGSENFASPELAIAQDSCLSVHDQDTASLPPIERFKRYKVSMDDPCYKVLPAALKQYRIRDDWRNYKLYIVYGDRERCLDLEEKPLVIFIRLDRAGKKPIVHVRKRKEIADSSAQD